MLAAESGADYVMFGEPDADGARPPFEAIVERVEWWAEVFQIPCVAYAAASTRSRRSAPPARISSRSATSVLGDPRGVALMPCRGCVACSPVPDAGA